MPFITTLIEVYILCIRRPREGGISQYPAAYYEECANRYQNYSDDSPNHDACDGSGPESIFRPEIGTRLVTCYKIDFVNEPAQF